MVRTCVVKGYGMKSNIDGEEMQGEEEARSADEGEEWMGGGKLESEKFWLWMQLEKD